MFSHRLLPKGGHPHTFIMRFQLAPHDKSTDRTVCTSDAQIGPCALHHAQMTYSGAVCGELHLAACGDDVGRLHLLDPRTATPASSLLIHKKGTKVGTGGGRWQHELLLMLVTSIASL